MEIFLVIIFVVLCLCMALTLWVMAWREDLPPDDKPTMPNIDQFELTDAEQRKLWEQIK